MKMNGKLSQAYARQCLTEEKTEKLLSERKRRKKKPQKGSIRKRHPKHLIRFLMKQTIVKPVQFVRRKGFFNLDLNTMKISCFLSVEFTFPSWQIPIRKESKPELNQIKWTSVD
jgi:hypothetical protein